MKNKLCTGMGMLGSIIASLLEEAFEEVIDSQSLEIELEDPITVIDWGATQVTIAHGLSVGTEESTFTHTLNFSDLTSLVDLMDSVEYTISANIGNNVKASGFGNNLYDLGVELQVGAFSFSVKVSTTGRTEYEFRIDYPEYKIIPGATGNYYVKVSIKTNNSASLAPEYATEPIAVLMIWSMSMQKTRLP